MSDQAFRDLAAQKKVRLCGAELAEFEAELAKVEGNWSATRMIDLVKDELPPETRPGGANPLGLLHGALSEGLHGKNEDECLDLARDLHMLLVGLFKQLDAANQARHFERQIRTVEEKRRRAAKPE